eukprot:365279-Chlamydomonas_euryale.AAC.11
MRHDPCAVPRATHMRPMPCKHAPRACTVVWPFRARPEGSYAVVMRAVTRHTSLTGHSPRPNTLDAA